MRVQRFLEKPAQPPPFPADPTKALASMGNYLFNFEALRRTLIADHEDPASSHDMTLPTW